MVLGRCEKCGAIVLDGAGYMLAEPRIGSAESRFAGEVVGYDHHYFHTTCPEGPPPSDPSKRKVQGT